MEVVLSQPLLSLFPIILVVLITTFKLVAFVSHSRFGCLKRFGLTRLWHNHILLTFATLQILSKLSKFFWAESRISFYILMQKFIPMRIKTYTLHWFTIRSNIAFKQYLRRILWIHYSFTVLVGRRHITNLLCFSCIPICDLKKSFNR